MLRQYFIRQCDTLLFLISGPHIHQARNANYFQQHSLNPNDFPQSQLHIVMRFFGQSPLVTSSV